MTLEVFRKCDAKYDWFAYVRFGLYYVSRGGERTNFCDIHFGWLPTEPIDYGVFSGPKDSTKDITRYGRTQEAIRRYDRDHKVHSDLVLSGGGRAKLVQNSKRKTIDVWLFGPVLFEGVGYGSLVAELAGLELPKTAIKRTPIDEKTGKERDIYDPKKVRYLVFYPKNYASRYHACTLWGSTYSDGTKPRAPGDDNIIHDGGSTVHYEDNRAPGEKDYVKPGPAPALTDALESARTSLKMAFLPKNAIRVEWKIEDYSANLTDCQVLERGG